MVKKLCSGVAVLLFASLVLFISIESVVRVHPSLAVASLKFTVSQETTSSAIPKVNYDLPYPGLLPDHPLYKIKMIRDRVWIWLTPEANERTALFLLYADKRVGAGKTLIEENKVDLGLSTILKGEKYLEKAIEEAKKAKKAGKLNQSLVEKLKTASLKHEEVLLGLKGKIDGEGKTVFDELLKFVDELQKRLTEI